jgi:hypothetical protein
MACEICHTTLGPFYRNGPKGGAPHWRCRQCLDTQPPSDVEQLVRDVEARR